MTKQSPETIADLYAARVTKLKAHAARQKVDVAEVPDSILTGALAVGADETHWRLNASAFFDVIQAGDPNDALELEGFQVVGSFEHGYGVALIPVTVENEDEWERRALAMHAAQADLPSLDDGTPIEKAEPRQRQDSNSCRDGVSSNNFESNCKSKWSMKIQFLE